MKFLTQDFFARPPNIVAQELLGCLLIRDLRDSGKKVARIVEVEAYLADNDPAAHHARYGRTPTREALYGDAGTLYIHPMRAYVGMDIVTEGREIPSSILVRAAEPMAGFDDSEMRDGKLLSGPGKLCRGLNIGRDFYGLNITDGSCGLRIAANESSVEIGYSHRVGITHQHSSHLRFFWAGHKSVSSSQK